MTRETTRNRLRDGVPLIAPSMLKCDFANLQRDFSLLEQGGADVIHLDVMDGHFVPNLSYGPMVIERLRDLTDRPFEAHLMISEPDRYLDDYIAAGCDVITFHVEAVPDAAPLLQRVQEADAVAGLALNPGTPLSAIEPFLPLCDVVLVMSVEPGFGGQSFMPAVLDKVRRLADIRPDGLLISIDGGVALPTIGEASEAGADIFVIGSAIFETTDYSETIYDLRAAAVERRRSATLGA